MAKLGVTKRIYIDAFLQNLKSVTFFTFLPVLIARLGASNFEIALSNSLPALFCALSLAFLTRQLPVTRGVFLTAGYVRQFAFLCMAISVITPYPIALIISFWALNAVAVMVTGAQQPAIMRRWVDSAEFPKIFSNIKIISIIVMTAGSFLLGLALDGTDHFFPYNFAISMIVGCLATFAGMALIATLAPAEPVPIKLKFVRPLQDADRTIWWMGFNNLGIAMAAPLFTIYHVKMLHLSNSQIAIFVIASGIASSLILPFVRRWIERFGARKVYSIGILGLALLIFPYGFVSGFIMLVVLQTCMGLCMAVTEVTTGSIMMEEADKHTREMAYFSDFHLIMNAGNGIGALLAGVLLVVAPLYACFIWIAAIRLLIYLYGRPRRKRPAGEAVG